MFAVVFEPDAGVEDVPQQVHILHTGQALKAAGTVGEQQLEDLPHLFFIAGQLVQAAQRVVGSLFQVAVVVQWFS